MQDWLADKLPLGLAILSLPISIVALILALSVDNPTNIYESGSLTGEETARTAAQALERAEQNNETVDTVLGLLEVGLGLLAGIAGVAAIVFTVNLRDIRSDLEQRAEANETHVQDQLAATQAQVEQRLSQRERELNSLGTQLREVADTTRHEITQLSSNTSQQITHLTQLIERKLDEARQEAENAFKVLSLQLLAEQQVRARNYKTAIQTLEEAYSLDNTNQTTNYLLGYLYTTRRRYEEARDYLHQALEISPDFAPALAALGLVQRRMGDREENIERRNALWAKAEANLLRALEIDPNMVDADGESYYGTLGGLYRRQNRLGDALHAYQQAVSVTPQSSYPAGNLAVLYKVTGRDAEADEMFARVQEIAETILKDNPSDHWTRLDLGQALLAQNKTEDALREYRQLLFRDPPLATLDIGANGLEFLRQSPTPIPGLEEAIALLRDSLVEREQAQQQVEDS